MVPEAMLGSLLRLVILAATPETVSLDALTSHTSAAGTPIVLEVFTQWCHPCALLEKTVFPAPQVVAALAKARVARYDAERGLGLDVADRFGVTTYPTVLVLTPDGVRVGHITAQSPREFANEATALLRLASTKGPYTAESADPRAVYIAGLKALRDSPSAPKTVALFEAAAAKDRENAAGVKWQALAMVTRLHYQAASTALKVNTLLELLQGDPLASATLEALGTLTTMPGASDAARAKAAGDRIRAAAVAAKNTPTLNSLLYVQLSLMDMDSALVTAKALEALTPSSDELDSVAEAYFQANQKEKALEIEARLVKATGGEVFKASLERFRTEEPAPPPYLGPNPLSSLEPAQAKNVFFAEVTRLGSALVDACRTSAGQTKSTFVRFSFNGPKVSRAVAFDLEAPSGLRKCLEKSAKAMTSSALQGQALVDVEVRFPTQ